MEEGLLPIAHGLHWLRGRSAGTSAGLGKGAGGSGVMAEDVPGTHAVMRPNRMEAWRCKKCKLILFRYGQSWDANKKIQKQIEGESAQQTEEASEA